MGKRRRRSGHGKKCAKSLKQSFEAGMHESTRSRLSILSRKRGGEASEIVTDGIRNATQQAEKDAANQEEMIKLFRKDLQCKAEEIEWKEKEIEWKEKEMKLKIRDVQLKEEENKMKYQMNKMKMYQALAESYRTAGNTEASRRMLEKAEKLID